VRTYAAARLSAAMIKTAKFTDFLKINRILIATGVEIHRKSFKIFKIEAQTPLKLTPGPNRF
jgi:hypothetical protein